MVSYEREEFSQLTKDQLLDYIEQQQDQLSRFELRFRGESRFIIHIPIKYMLYYVLTPLVLACF